MTALHSETMVKEEEIRELAACWEASYLNPFIKWFRYISGKEIFWSRFSAGMSNEVLRRKKKTKKTKTNMI